jgi:thymidylate kinase
MGDMPTKFLIDGIDRLGKSTLIQRLQEELGYHLVIHYDKPKVLSNLLDTADCIKRAEVSETDYDESYRNLSIENLARRLYQEDANRGMFELLKSEVPIIFDRTHLGEMVYAPLYRGYSGDYVYEMEQDLIESKPYTIEKDVRLILLTSSNTDMLVDDGLSFDPAKKSEEQERFIQAFNKSRLVNKVMVDVHNGNGGYRSYEDILNDALYK